MNRWSKRICEKSKGVFFLSFLFFFFFSQLLFLAICVFTRRFLEHIHWVTDLVKGENIEDEVLIQFNSIRFYPAEGMKRYFEREIEGNREELKGTNDNLITKGHEFLTKKGFTTNYVSILFLRKACNNNYTLQVFFF